MQRAKLGVHVTHIVQQLTVQGVIHGSYQLCYTHRP